MLTCPLVVSILPPLALRVTRYFLAIQWAYSVAGGFVPTVKIATNSELAAKKKHWIDFDAGQLIHGKAMPQLLEEFIDTIVEFANGKQTCNERNDFRELAIFKSGVTL